MLTHKTFTVMIWISTLLLWALPVFAQVDTAWVRRYSTPGDSTDRAVAIALDDFGNVYVTGYGYSSSTGYDYITIKYDEQGDTVWVRTYNGPGDSTDYALGMDVDYSGNVFVTGYSYGIGTSYDWATVKYYPNGDVAWVSRFNGPPGGSDDYARAIATDGSGNVYVTGWSYDNGPYFDYATVKYYPNGDTAWVRRYVEPENSGHGSYAIAVDVSGNVFVAGESRATGTGIDYATIKYYPNGDTAWLRRYNGPGNAGDAATVLALDISGNACVAGFSAGVGTDVDFATVKYDPEGNEMWVQRYNGPGNINDAIRAIAVDDSGNICVTGRSYDAEINGDYTTIKYHPSGDTAWLRKYNGPGDSDDYARAIAVDGSGSVYVSGESYDAATHYDYATLRYDITGEEIWVTRYNGPGNGEDKAKAIAVDEAGNVYVTGWSYGDGTGYDYATIKYVQNYPPESFSLLSPPDSAPVLYVVSFGWETAADPDSGDEIRYDLHISTSPTFTPDSMVIHDSLETTTCTDTLGLGRHYWKVRAYDDKGGERWSDQTWSFVSSLPSALVGYWKFDEGTGSLAYDSSGYGNDGTLVNGPVWADGISGKALRFDGIDDRVSVPDNLVLKPPALTVMGWIRPLLLPPSGQNYGIVMKGDPGVQGSVNWQMQVWWTGQVSFGYDNGAWYDSPWSESKVEVGQWNHLAVTFQSRVVKTYFNAQLDSAFPYTMDADLNTEYTTPVTVAIGWEGGLFWGTVDQVKIYTYALSSEEVAQEFEGSFVHGDANADGVIDIGDVVCLVNYLYKNGPPPAPLLQTGDSNCDGVVNIGDVVYLVNYLFKSGPAPGC